MSLASGISSPVAETHSLRQPRQSMISATSAATTRLGAATAESVPAGADDGR